MKPSKIAILVPLPFIKIINNEAGLRTTQFCTASTLRDYGNFPMRATRKVIIKKMVNKIIKKLDGANMDIDLATDKKDIQWYQDKCPWNEVDNSIKHKCAVKNISICPYFCGIEYLDDVLCCYPNENPKKGNE